jgi:hypothetical protein
MRRYQVFFAVIMLALAGVVWAAPPAQIKDFNNFLLNTRADLETLANKILGEGQRPPTWTFNVQVGSATFVSDLWFDNEQLADKLFAGKRPDLWIGAPITKNSVIVVRNIRHDLELSADTGYGGEANRPTEWREKSPIYHCERTLLNLTEILRTAYNISFQTKDDAVNYCKALTDEADNQVLKLALTSPDIDAQIDDLILSVRGDLERLADEKLGLNNRPPEWKGNKDKNSPTLPTDNSLDLELLADNLLNGQPRPPGWIGSPLPNAKIYAYRNMRHDLELLANAIGQIPRPRGWQGTDPQAACAPVTQDLVIMAQKSYSFASNTVATEGNFCFNLATAANKIIESPPEAPESTEQPAADKKFVAESRYAFAYLDPAASQYMGVMPPGTKFKAWYRNFGESTMMFVSGQDFAVYLDRRWTTLSEEVFARLPSTEGVKPLTFCDAKWCNGPGPTPTPTGSGAIVALINQATAPAAPNVEDLGGQKKQVSWNNIRVTYLLDNPASRSAQVTLQICADTSQTDCEPVTKIFDKTAGAPKPVLSQSNGLNVYEFPYGYTANLVIEGATRFSPDVWISDPTIR